MPKSLIAMTSITYAMKAKRMLNEKGFYCEITRTPKGLGSGCGYCIQVTKPPKEIILLLEQNGIVHKNILINAEG
ncbi:MAG: DUF3343 domain-containing protein [Ruminococcus sp.]|nr:DUF3343 domain-containing protein [Ruminococcus sp.]